jgi:hypothetical protein
MSEFDVLAPGEGDLLEIETKGVSPAPDWATAVGSRWSVGLGPAAPSMPSRVGEKNRCFQRFRSAQIRHPPVIECLLHALGFRFQKMYLTGLIANDAHAAHPCRLADRWILKDPTPASMVNG